jgi:ADP-ribose pyrophosphatase
MSEKRTTLAAGKFLKLCAVDGWEYCERVNASAVVGVLGITPEGRILLVEQYRPPLGRNAIEIPAGLVGDSTEHAGEDPAVAAARELEEETGYRASGMLYLGKGPSSAGLTTETVTLYHGTGLQKVGEGLGDGNERITLHEVPLGELRRFLARRAEEGVAIDLKIYSAMLLAGMALA